MRRRFSLNRGAHTKLPRHSRDAAHPMETRYGPVQFTLIPASGNKRRSRVPKQIW